MASYRDRPGPAAALRPMLLFFAEDREGSRAEIARLLQHPDEWVRAAARTMRIAMSENDGDVETWRADVERAVREWTDVGDRWGLASALTSRGSLRVLDGDLLGAVADLEAAQTNRRLLGSSDDDVRLEMRLAEPVPAQRRPARCGAAPGGRPRPAVVAGRVRHDARRPRRRAGLPDGARGRRAAAVAGGARRAAGEPRRPAAAPRRRGRAERVPGARHGRRLGDGVGERPRAG
ncbi:hypothetical protein GCM10025868_14080 [Angustibacter aerolatus]|uniref:DUF222 domain-containing protein n=1 Tax=Angustibacter aerolatus TaxID=1162965 RepID=A0ABQ6JDD0_9ACTN|nr:hypothetical protein [Angustibacter aerolatus]GMA86158.1 hypothetical protein GCM10025868_14080 [Angustibacter aerolatus]